MSDEIDERAVRRVDEALTHVGGPYDSLGSLTDEDMLVVVRAVWEDRWAALTDRELGLLIGGLESAERDGTIDHAGKALHAELEQELARRVGDSPS